MEKKVQSFEVIEKIVNNVVYQSGELGLLQLIIVTFAFSKTDNISVNETRDLQNKTVADKLIFEGVDENVKSIVSMLINHIEKSIKSKQTLLYWGRVVSYYHNIFDREWFLSNYPLIINYLVDRYYHEFLLKTESFLPKEVSCLIDRIMSIYSVSSVLNLFAGYGFLGCTVENEIKYLCVENNDVLFGLKSILADAINNNIIIEKSKVDCQKYVCDAVVSLAPSRFFSNKNIKDDIFSLDKILDSASSFNYLICVVPFKFCLSTKKDDYHLRSKIIESKMLNTIIELPNNIKNLSSSSFSILLFNSKNRTNQVRFIDAKKMYILDEERNCMLLVDDIIQKYLYEKDSFIVSSSLFSRNEFALFSQLYHYVGSDTNGMSVNKIKHLLVPDESKKLIGWYGYTKGKVLSEHCFSDDIYDILTIEKEPDVSLIKKSYIEECGKCIVLTAKDNKLNIYIHNDNSSFYVNRKYVVLHFDESCVNIKYIACLLMQSQHFSNLFVELYSYSSPTEIAQYTLNYRLVYHQEKTYQLSHIQSVIENCKIEKISSLKAEEERYGIRQASSDIAHILGTSFEKQSNIINYLVKKSNDVPTYYMTAVNALIDNIQFQKRVIKYLSVDFNEITFNKGELNIVDFINDYTSSWKNFCGSHFKISFDDSSEGQVVVDADRDKLLVLFDTILDNAYRHGFDKVSNINNEVSIFLSNVSLSGRQYVMISFANNGKPLDDDISLEDFICRGRYSKESGRTGLGGNHIYTIVKKHGGYISLGQNKKWPFIIDILLPIESSINNKYIDFLSYEQKYL